jgi:Gp157 protein
VSDQYLFLDAAFVKAEVGKLLAEYPELEDDEELRGDMIAGETDAHKIIARALEARQEAESMAGAVKARVIDLSARQSRYERKSEAMRTLIRNIMQAAKLPKLTLPEATLSITAPRQTVGIEDLDALPQGYFKTVRQADKDAIKQALAGGAEIPGAILVTGSSGLMIRTK